mmetsp:Transcript_9447/g.16542  ORF Transcript_9447/g.16542 Transcript_9447/m.16542 type:complete len:133 (+) Transcript_9447:1641-2039(+)
MYSNCWAWACILVFTTSRGVTSMEVSSAPTEADKARCVSVSSPPEGAAPEAEAEADPALVAPVLCEAEDVEDETTVATAALADDVLGPAEFALCSCCMFSTSEVFCSSRRSTADSRFKFSVIPRCKCLSDDV